MHAPDFARSTRSSPHCNHCRNPEKSQKAAEAVKSASGNDRVHALSADLSSLEAVRSLAADVKAAAPDGLDVLINNAGDHLMPVDTVHSGIRQMQQRCKCVRALVHCSSPQVSLRSVTRSLLTATK